MCKPLIGALALALFAGEANAGSVTITAGPTGSQQTRTWTLADGVFASRMLPALKWHYGKICSGTPVVCVDRTNAQAFDALNASFEQAIRDIVKRYEIEQGRTTSDAAVTVLP